MGCFGAARDMKKGYDIFPKKYDIMICGMYNQLDIIVSKNEWNKWLLLLSYFAYCVYVQVQCTYFEEK